MQVHVYCKNIILLMVLRFPSTPCAERWEVKKFTFSIFFSMKQFSNLNTFLHQKQAKKIMGSLGSCDSLKRNLNSNTTSQIPKIYFLFQKVYAFFFFFNEPHTLYTILFAINNDHDIPNIERTSFYKLLLPLGAEFVTRNKKSLVVDRDNIILW